MIGVNVPTWMEAMEAQLDAVRLIEFCLRMDTQPTKFAELHSSWNVDRRLLNMSRPFTWSPDVTAAVMEASRSIPLETRLNHWNLQTEAVWWYFERPLPIQTVIEADVPIRALNFGWIPTEDGSFGMPCICWVTGLKTPGYRVAPSQTWEWSKDTTLGEMLEATRAHHRHLYGPGGRWEKRQQVGEDKFMEATEALSRFILAGLAWLNQKVLVTDSGHVERHRRKAFDKATNGKLDAVRIVHLRRSQYPKREATPDEDAVEWTCRWVVSGHWRNQACGPKHVDRRLTYVLPYVKGPEDKPIRTSLPAAYVVDR